MAVHGITGDSIKTFTYSENKCFWLGDADMLPRDISNSRVLTYSYPADVASVFKPACADTIMHIAQTLVAELVADREAQSPFLIEALTTNILNKRKTKKKKEKSNKLILLFNKLI